jgi:hypothetical protein
MEAASSISITIGDLTRISLLSSVGSSLCIGAVNVEVGNELKQQRRGGGKVWVGRRWNDNEAIREVELMVRIENGLRCDGVRILVSDRQRRDVIELRRLESYFGESWLVLTYIQKEITMFSAH